LGLIRRKKDEADNYRDSTGKICSVANVATDIMYRKKKTRPECVR